MLENEVRKLVEKHGMDLASYLAGRYLTWVAIRHDERLFTDAYMNETMLSDLEDRIKVIIKHKV